MTNMLIAIELPDEFGYVLPYTVPEHVTPAIDVVPEPVVATYEHDAAASHVPVTVMPFATVYE